MQNTRLPCPDETVAGTQGYRIDVSLRSAGNPLAEPAEPEIHGTAFVLLLETKQSTSSKGWRQSFSPVETQNRDNENLERTHEMRQTLTTLKFLTVIALLAFAVGCASEGENKQNLAIAAGFKIITPKNAEQQSILTQLPKDQVTPVDYKGKRYYVLPDVANNQAYVGGAEQYQAYQQIRMAQHLSNQNLEAAQMNQMATMNWGAWGGWGGYGGWGWR